MNNNLIVKNDLKEMISNNDGHIYFNKNILITGGTGLISTYLLMYFIELNKEHNANIGLVVNVRNANKLKNRVSDLDNVMIIEKNVEDIKPSDIKLESIDYIFHLASSSSPYVISNHPTSIINANVNGTQAALEIAKEFDAEIIFSSTREVYGAVDKEVILESDVGKLQQHELRACYPESKRLAETLIFASAYEFGIKYKIARIAHVYGPGMTIEQDGRIMSDLLGNVVRSENIELMSDGSALRSFCYITDAVEGLLLLPNAKENDTFNLANEYEEISILNLSKLLIELFPNKNLALTYKENTDYKAGYVSFKRVSLSTEKIETLGWKPHVNLQEGLVRTVKFYD